MKITLRGKNIEITEAIEEKVSEKLSKLDKYFIVSENVEAKVLVRTYPYGQKIEVTIPTEYVLLRAEVVDQDLYNAIDLVIDKLEGQIRKSKTKKDKQNMTNTIRFQAAQSANDDVEIDGEIIKTIYYSIKPLTAEDAKLILEGDSKNKFLPFINVETNKVNVIYKLKDGKNFGMLEPEA